MAWKVPPIELHWASVLMKHPALGVQQAPVTGGGQEVDVHWVPGPRNVPPCDWHWVCVVIAQPPLGPQHAPRLAQLASAQFEPSP